MRPRTSRSLFVVLAALCLAAIGSTSSASAQVVAPYGPRLRIGLEAGAGGEWGTPRGPSIGLFGQLGVQFSPTVALYYQPSLYAHGLRSSAPNTFLATGHLAMMDFTFGILQFGAGAGMDLGRYATCDDNGCNDGPRVANPAVGGRLALVPSFPGVRARIGIPIGVQIHSTFFDRDERLTSILLTLGVQRF